MYVRVYTGPGESKLETDKRVIRDKIVRVKKEIEGLGAQRIQHRKTRYAYAYIIARIIARIYSVSSSMRLYSPYTVYTSY